MPADLAAETARALAGLEDPEIATVGADLPDRASLVTLLELDPTPDTLLGRWKAAGQVPKLAAPIGVAEAGSLVIDLVADGPHGLIAGTTGAGKSELLRTMVASMAATVGPEHLTFLLIDYKGGSAFAQCAALPHTVGMVTDLDEHLGQRALRCLEAELRYRELRLRDAGANDLKEYLLQGNKEPLPRLVVIIDEFATMVAELPDFIDSLVGVAQRGRSLGVHMILATQRPGGAVNNNIRANTNLRISLRVQDVAESIDVIGSPQAAAIGRYQAGRGYLRLGPGETFPFQTALVTGVTKKTVSTGINVRPYAFGPDPNRAAPSAAGASTAAPAAPSGPTDSEPSDLEQLVAAAAEAARVAGIPPARRPCPEPLPERVTLDELGTFATTGFAAPFGLQDDPDHQAQGPVALDPLAGNILFFGVSGAGTTSALGTLAVSLARHYPVERLHLYVLDFGTQALATLAPLPHVGAVVGAADLERQARLMRQLNDELDRRRQWVAQSGAARVDPTDLDSPFPLVVLLLDNFSGFASQYEMGSMGGVRDQFSKLISDGPGLGVVVAVSADRPNAVPGSIAALVPQKLVFRLGDTSDFGLLGIPPRDVPKLPPGRAIDAMTKLEVQVALPGPEGLAAAVAAVAEGVDVSAVDATRRPRPIGTLVNDVTLAEIADGLSIGEEEWVIPIGIGDTSLAPVALRLPAGEHVLIAGPPRSG
ncbi:MAG: FtsK/SpoIIIE domain-containing protein, partial [Actinomycetota bacterium]|nr:FtsK/SpoIIIE domain-containing protein [Actinomycetota bacterium]